jgi:tetratricopeptide (TPR) repeat protein
MKSRSHTSVLLAPVLLLLTILTVPSHICAQATSGSVLGEVRVSPGNPISKPILVTLQGRGTIVGQAYTDEEGHFFFNNLPGNVYHIVINEDGYDPVNEQVVSDPETSPMRLVNIYLVPHNAEKSRDTAVAGENAYLTNEAEYGKVYPKDAIREFKAGKKADQKGKVDEAIHHYEKAVSLAPTFYMARNNLGTLYLGKADYTAAQGQFDKVIGTNPNDVSAYFNLANLYLLQNRYDDAERFVEKGLSKQSSSAFGNFLRGSLYARTGNTHQAEASLRRSLELDPKMAQTHLALVNLFMQEKRSADAIAELKTFLKEFPEHQFAPKARDVLNRLENLGAQPN